MLKIVIFGLSSVLLAVAFKPPAHASETIPFFNECLGWKKTAGFNTDRTEVRKGCRCIDQQLSSVSSGDRDIAQAYLKVVLEYPGRAREGLQDYFLEKVAQDTVLKEVREEKSTRLFNFLGRTMKICLSKLPDNE